MNWTNWLDPIRCVAWQAPYTHCYQLPFLHLQRVYLVSADVGSLAVKDAVQEVMRQMGHVDVLVNCAGTFHTAPLHETPPEKYEVRVTQHFTHY